LPGVCQGITPIKEMTTYQKVKGKRGKTAGKKRGKGGKTQNCKLAETYNLKPGRVRSVDGSTPFWWNYYHKGIVEKETESSAGKTPTRLSKGPSIRGDIGTGLTHNHWGKEKKNVVISPDTQPGGRKRGNDQQKNRDSSKEGRGEGDS